MSIETIVPYGLGLALFFVFYIAIIMFLEKKHQKKGLLTTRQA